MNVRCMLILVLSVLLSSCAHQSEQGTIAELDDVHIVPKDVKVDGGLEKAMQGYQKFLEKTPDSNLTPEAIRRIADLKLEKEYGVVADGDGSSEPKTGATASAHGAGVAVTAPSTEDMSQGNGNVKEKEGKSTSAAFAGESDKDFEKRTTQEQQIGSSAGNKKLVLPDGNPGADLQNADADQAIALYKKLLKKYPLYERNDQVLYQLSRAYEETGRVDEAMAVMNRLVKQFPQSRYTDEVQFRRGEYFFTRRKYLDAEDAYGAVLKFGVKTVYYQRALYKKGWTFYKEGMYEEALQQFFGLLDYKVSTGYDFDQKKDNIERKRVSDTLRVVSLSFSNLGGPTAVQDYFRKYGSRSYEDRIYGALAEFYFSKRRYSDAATTYNTFVAANPFHRKAPQFSMRVIQIYMKGGFPRLVVEAKKQFAATYALDGEYWKHFNKDDRPEVLGYLKTNLIDLADHYHSLYQNKKFRKDRRENFAEASRWYRAFLKSFPKDKQSAGINYQLAELLLENGNYKAAAVEYEHSAYDYPANEKSPKAAYATVYAYREYLKTAPASEVNDVKQDIIRTSLRLVDTFPKHEKATVVLGALVDDLFEMKKYEMAIKEGHRLIDDYPDADKNIRRGAWLDVAHSSYEIKRYKDAENAYIETLKMTTADAKDRQAVIDDLAASVYKQGEVAKAKGDYETAVRQFLRIAEVAPTSKIRPSAEYDAAAVLIQMKDLERAAGVLLSFRKNYPGHKLQHDVTKKLAYVYKGLGKNIQAAQEYERVAKNESKDELVREAMLAAADLYGKAQDTDDSLRVYKQYVEKFPKPLESALETYYKIAEIYKSQGNQGHYFGNLRYIITADAEGGKERTDRTRYLAAQASLELVEPRRIDYMAIKLVKPFKASLNRKEKSMKSLVRAYARLVDYRVADVTAASTYYIAEIYYNFDQSLLKSERPDKLSDVELDEFNEMVEEQAYPFEVKAIQVHEKNVALLKTGIHSVWIDRSIEKLAKLVPARYGKPEQSANFITKINSYIYSSPRYLRDDASTGYIENLTVFRYSSQNQESVRNQSASDADTNAEATSAPKSETVTAVTPQKTGKAKVAVTSTTGHKASDAGGPAQVSKAVDATVKTQDPAEKHTVKTVDAKTKVKKVDSGSSDSNTSTPDADGQAGNSAEEKSTVTGTSNATTDHKAKAADAKTKLKKVDSGSSDSNTAAPDADGQAGNSADEKSTVTGTSNATTDHTAKAADTKAKLKKVDSGGSDSKASAPDADGKAGNSAEGESTVTGASNDTTEHTVKTTDTKAKLKKVDSGGSGNNTTASDAEGQAGSATERNDTTAGESDGAATEDKTATQGEADEQKNNEPAEDVTGQ